MDEYISREEAIKELREVYEQEYPTANGDFDEYANHDVPNVLRNIKATDVQPVKLIQRIVQGRLNGANYTLLEAVKSNDTNTAYKMRGAIDICNEILADLRILTAKDGEQNDT